MMSSLRRLATPAIFNGFDNLALARPTVAKESAPTHSETSTLPAPLAGVSLQPSQEYSTPSYVSTTLPEMKFGPGNLALVPTTNCSGRQQMAWETSMYPACRE